MKTLLLPCFLATCVWLAAPAALAQSTAHPAAKKARAGKAHASASRTEIKSTANQMAAGIAAAEAALDPTELAIAEQVHTGVLRCDLGASVTLTNDPQSPGYFNVLGKNFRYRMIPVATSTGAIRLEDYKSGAVWLQLPNKSMLMNQKAGQRMADECMSPAQLTVAQAMREKLVPGLLD
ncbi:MAG: ribosomal protein S20 [Polaromonas sp.]|jgi:ribosomal protein S20